MNWTGVLLIALAFALFFIDLFVSSFGLLLIGGMLAFIFGSYMLVDETVPGYSGVSRPVIWVAAGLVLASAITIGLLVVRLQRSTPKTGKKSILGQVATVRSPLTPSGMVFFDGELWQATLVDAGETAAIGAQVKVVSIEGIRLTVALTDESETNPMATTSRRETLVPVS